MKRLVESQKKQMVKDEQELKRNQENLEQLELIRALSYEYLSVYKVNLETKEVEVKETVEVEIPETPVADVVVDTESAKVNTGNKPNGNVKIRMRTDHKCCIAMERYDLKAGKTYVVPENVKRILNKAGLLAPL